MSDESPTELPLTEQENPRTRGLSELPTAEVLRLMNEEDAGVAEAVAVLAASADGRSGSTAAPHQRCQQQRQTVSMGLEHQEPLTEPCESKDHAEQDYAPIGRTEPSDVRQANRRGLGHP